MKITTDWPKYIFAYMVLIFLIPFKACLSVAIILLAISVFFSQPLKGSINNLKSRKGLILLISTYFIYLIGLIYTENISFGMREIEYKLSLLIMPIIIGATPSLHKERMNKLLATFVLSCFLSAITCLAVTLIENNFAYIPTYSELSIFLSPNYFVLYIDFCIILLITSINQKLTLTKKTIHLFLLLFFIAFNILLSSKMGIIIMLVILVYYCFNSLKQYSPLLPVAVILAGVIGFSILVNTNKGIRTRFTNLQKALSSENIDKNSTESSKVRLLIWEQAVNIIKTEPLLGVGTGDSKDSLLKKYEEAEISHAIEKKYNTHNQYLEWLITLGIAGFLILEGSIIFVLIQAIKKKNSILVWFIIINSLAFLTESTLETQAGLIFFSLFFVLLFFHYDQKDYLEFNNSSHK